MTAKRWIFDEETQTWMLNKPAVEVIDPRYQAKYLLAIELCHLVPPRSKPKPKPQRPIASWLWRTGKFRAMTTSGYCFTIMKERNDSESISLTTNTPTAPDKVDP